MERKLRILLVDDNPDDRLLAARELRKEFPDLIVEEVGTAAALEEAMAARLDLVITDFHLPWTSGLEVLRLIKKRFPHCPVIMFTGTGSEEVAVQAMKDGLDDYVLKSAKHCGRLGAAARAVMEKNLAAQRADQLDGRLQSLLERLQVGVFRAGSDGLLLEANPAFLKLIGWSELPADSYLRELYFRPELHAEHMHYLKRSGELHEYEVELCRSDGGSVLVSMSQSIAENADGEPIIDGMVEDISQRVKLQTELRQVQKLESIGRLAAGVAHDFNNILTIIQGYAGLLGQKEFDADSTFALKNINSAVDRAAMLTRQLLAFSRKQVIQLQVVDVSSLLQNLSSLMRHILGDAVTLELNCHPDLPTIRGDEALLQQVLMNLAMNARDAMPQGGKFTVSAGFVEMERDYVRAHWEARPGTFIYIAVTDTGNGIAPENLNRIFEPFFTTKEVGKGTGLGLAAVYGIIKQHKGWIEVSSQIKNGTSFRLFIPAEPKLVAMPVPPSTDREGNETVLLVEDEVELLDLVGEVLQSSGYQVIPAATGKRALELWQHSRQRIDLLITDMKMPDATGLDLAQTLVSENPHLKVLYTSGYSPDAIDPKVNLREGYNYLQKPYPPDRLLTTIRNVLEARRVDDITSEKRDDSKSSRSPVG